MDVCMFVPLLFVYLHARFHRQIILAWGAFGDDLQWLFASSACLQDPSSAWVNVCASTANPCVGEYYCASVHSYVRTCVQYGYLTEGMPLGNEIRYGACALGCSLGNSFHCCWNQQLGRLSLHFKLVSFYNLMNSLLHVLSPKGGQESKTLGNSKADINKPHFLSANIYTCTFTLTANASKNHPVRLGVE